jgi:tetratricopeptide (TPR) repeat protein
MRTLSLALALVALACPPLLAARQDGPDAAQQVEKYKKYLARKPYHDTAFDTLISAAVSINGLKDLVTFYEARVAADSDALADRVVLARLYARTDQAKRAIEELRSIEGEDAELLRLIGQLELRRGEIDAALEALDRAALATEDEQLLEDIHSQRGQAYLQAGDKDKAYAAFRALAELEPENFHLRLEAASKLAYHGLTEQALAEFAVAQELAGEDTAKRCRVLAEIGTLHERLSQGQQALDIYDLAIGLMSRGNWLKRDLHERVIALHKRAGTLEQLIEKSAREAADEPRDLDKREFHARALEAAGRHTDARDILRTATTDFPGDLKLSRRLLDVLEVLDDAEGRIAEYQRILIQCPEELELYLELGQVFASEGRFEQARLQWNRTLEQRLTDAGLCIRLASFYALFELAEDALAMYRKAIELEPLEMRHYADLVAFLNVRERTDEVPPILEQATLNAQGDAGRLEDVASLWAENGEPTRAREAVEAALELAPGDSKILNHLADLLIREENYERASATLHEVVNHASEASLRTSAVDKLVRLFRNQERLGELADVEQAAVDAGSMELAPYLVLGKLHKLRRAPEDAVKSYEQLLALHADSEDARKELAKLYEEQGEYRAALDQYDALVASRPQARRRYLKEVARIHLALLDQERAFECYEEILRDAPDNPSAFKEVADAYRTLGLHDKVVECLQQAVRLKPDDARMRLDLADAFRMVGGWEQARDHTVEAFQTKDPDLRERARKAYYLLLSEAGRIDEEIEALRDRVQDNPYDVEAPLTLIDIYVRELEYELALDLLERLIDLNPRELRLLEQRGRLLALMERYDEAIADYEALWKSPDADRNQLALQIAENAIEMGDIEYAKRVLAPVHDARKVARLYREHDLDEEAIAALERAVEGVGHGRLMLLLAETQQEIGDRAAAALVLERMLAEQGDSWKVLVSLGNLYHDLGRKDEAKDIGRRLFAMVRIDDKEENERDESEDEKDPWASTYRSSYRYSSWYQQNSSQYQTRLNELKEFFETKGYITEYLDLAVAEMRLQPANATLLDSTWWVFEQVEDREEQARDLMRFMRDRAAETGRTPPGYTQESWLRALDTREVGLYSDDNRFAEKRLAELGAAVAEGNASEEDYVERAQLLGYLQKDAERLESLRTGLAAFPDSVQLNAGLASVLHGEREYEEAVAVYRRLIPLLAASGQPEEDAQLFEIRFRQQRSTLQQGFPVHVQGRIREEHLRRLYGVTYGPSTYFSWGAGAQPSVDGARLRLATCLMQMERKDEAREVLVALEPENPEYLPRWSSLAATYYKEELHDDAARIYERMLAVEAALEADPVLGFNLGWMGQMNAPMGDFARVLEKRGEVLRALDLFLLYGHRNQGELLLTTHAGFADAEARYRARMDAEAAVFERGGDLSPWDTRNWRNAGIMLADVYQFQKQWDDVQRVYEELAARLPDDFGLRRNIAMLHVRAGGTDEAIEAHYEMIQRKKELNRAMVRQTVPHGRVLAPTPPPGVNEANYSVTSLGRGSSLVSTAIHNVREDYTQILKLHLDEKRPSKAAEVLRQIAREDVASFRYMGYQVRDLVNTYQLGREAVPIFRLLYSYNQSDNTTALEYARALIKAEEFEEAHKVLSTLVNKTRSYRYYGDQAQEELDMLEIRMGLDKQVTIADLEAKVAEDPKNIRSRMKLARRLFKERRFEEALVQGQAAEERAPHQDELKQFVTNCMLVLGRQEELETRLDDQRRRENDNEKKFALTVQLANWKWDRGDVEGALALFDDAFEVQSGGYANYAPSTWMIEKGLYEPAKVALEKEIEALGGGQWNSDEPRQRLEALYLLDGDVTKALDKAWERFEKANGRAEKLTFFKQLPGVLRRLPDPSTAKELMMERAAEAGGVQGGLYRAAYYLAVADMEQVEAELDTLVQTEEKALFLYPALVDLARGRGDLEGALAYLERLERALPLSKSRQLSTAIGQLSERNALLAEKGAILYELGQEDAAWALWEGMFGEEEKDEARTVMTALYALYELHDKAAELVREQLEEQGEKNYALLQTLAIYEVENGNLEEAARLLRRALILSGRNQTVRTALIGVQRKLGRVEEYYAEVKAEADTDPEDENVQRALMNLALELEHYDAAIEAAERVAKRPTDAGAMKAVLMRLQATLGRTEVARALRDELVAPGMTANERKNHGRGLANWLVDEGRADEAIALIESIYADQDVLDVQQQLAATYARAERWEDSLACADEILRIDSDDFSALYARERALRELGRDAEALQTIYAALREPQLDSSWSSWNLGLLVERSGEIARLEAALAEAPGDADRLFELGMCQAAVADWEGACASLEASLAQKPDNRVALRQLWPCQRQLERWDDAQATLEALIERLDREHGVSSDDWNLRNEVDNLKHEIARLHFLRGAPDTALAEWRKPRGKKYQPVESYSYSYWNNPLDQAQGYQFMHYLKQHGLYEQYLAAQRMYGWFDPWSAEWNKQDILETRFRAGDREAAMEDLWNKVADADRGLVTDYSSSWWWYDYDPFGGQGARSEWVALVRMFREEGRYDELKARIDARLAIDEEDQTMSGFRNYLRVLEEDWDPLLAKAEEAVQESPDDVQVIRALADKYFAYDRFDDALPHYERLRSMYRGQVSSSYTRYGFYSARSTTKSASSKLRFGWGGGWTGYGGSYSYWSNSGTSDESFVRRRLMALYRRDGRTEEANQLERVELELAEFESVQRAQRLLDLARAYGPVGLHDDVVRLAEEAARESQEHAETAWRLLAHHFREEAEDDARAREYALRLVAFHDEDIEEAPYSANALIARARFRLDELGDPQAAEADARAALLLDRFSTSAHLQLGRALRAQGRNAEALGMLRDAERLYLALGLHPGAELYYGLGLAQAAVEGPEAAEPVLRRALATDPDSKDAEETQTLLD